MHINRIEELPREPTRAVIINVGTELVSSLALASAVANCSMPILVINCDPTQQSSAHFKNLMDRWEFDLVDARRQVHGKVLDDLFRRIKADCVLLLDSDLELRDRDLVNSMRAHLAKPSVFAAGFVNGPHWLTEKEGCSPRTALLHERPWMPVVMFRTSDVREALAAGLSFKAHTIYNDFMFSRRISKVLAKRFQTGFVPRSRVVRHMPAGVQVRMREYSFQWLRWARQDFFGLRPNYVYCDTGTDVYQWCKYENWKIFAGASTGLLKGEVKHYSGVTRLKLNPRQRNATRLADIEDEVRGRLRDVYDLEVGEDLLGNSAM